MKKFFTSLVIATLLYLQFSPPGVVYAQTSYDVTIDPPTAAIDNLDSPAQAISAEAEAEGIGTPLVTVIGKTEQTCFMEPDPDGVTGRCPRANVQVRVYNDTGADRDLNVCVTMIQEGIGGPPSRGIITGTTPGLPPDGSGVYHPLPYSLCVKYNVDAGANGPINFDIDQKDGYGNSVGQEGALYIYHFAITLSWDGINTCDKNFTELSSDTFPIDPTIETPLGPEGSPADGQIFATVEGEYYSITTSGGWDDGANARKDAAISWDGTTWFSFASSDPECMKSGEGSDGTTYYLLAESETFYIRSNDTTGAFADNTPDPDFSYTIAQQMEVVAPCESQYSFDESGDLLGHTEVVATDNDGVLANNNGDPLVVGSWYMIRWTSGYWKDNGIGPDLTGVEYSYSSTIGGGGTWIDLAAGSSGVWCATDDGSEILFQATGENIYLRVNDVIPGFDDNTGGPFYDVFQVTFVRTPATCETQYQIGSLIHHGLVDGDQSGGTRFAFITTRPDGSVWGLPQGLEYGGWYVIDTTDGPWSEFSFGDEEWRYDMAVSDDGGDSWVALADWEHPVCNFEIDAIGHRRLILQMPFSNSGAVDWLFRVNDSGLFVGNQGSMEWDIYGATNLSSDPEGGECDYSFDLFGGGVVAGTIEGDDADGVPLLGLTAGEMYALKIFGSGDYGWKESLLDDEQFDAELSDDNGSSWSDLGDWDGALCSQEEDEDTTVFFTAGQNYNYFVRVNSTTFDNNVGELGYVVYAAQAGQSIVNTCFDGWSLQEIDPFEWLDVRAEGGEFLLSDNARYEEFVALVPGRSYAVETPAGQGPWIANDEPDGNGMEVAISNDNGVTWEEVSMENSMIDCASHAPLLNNSWKAKFTVEEGQVWKIRVNDETGEFTNNAGNMAFKFYVLCEGMACTGSVPNDSTTNGIPAVNIQGGGNVCSMAVLRPGPLTADEIFNLGTYLGSWAQYVNLSVLRYMAWCPTHTGLIQTFLNGLRTKEPLATLDELNQLLQYVQNELDTYDWGEWEDTSLFSVDGPSDVRDLVEDHILRRDADVVNPWNGEQLLEFGDTDLPSSYYSCSSAFANGLPTRLRSAVCFVSAYFKETGAAFWFQLLIVDIPAVGILLVGIKSTVEQAIILIVGVNPFQPSRRERIEVDIKRMR